MNLTLQSIPSPIISEILANSRLDGVVLDTEHGTFNNETLISCIQVITILNKKCFVRITNCNEQLIRMCLDNNATGLIFSTVESKNQGDEILKYCRYPSFHGKRGQALVRENFWGEKPLGKANPYIIAQIETKLGIDNIRKILTCGFNSYIVGPYDLSASLGCVGDWNNKLYKKYINKIHKEIPDSELGFFLPSKNDIDNYIRNKKTSSILIWGIDSLFILEKVKELPLNGL